MKELIIMITALLISLDNSGLAQSFKVFKDEKGRQVIVGKVSWKEWQDSSGWKDFSAKDYDISSENKAQLDSLINDKISFLLFAGSWCGDSETEVPVIYKIIRDIARDEILIMLIGVDRQKQDLEGEAAKYNITRVPTLIILKDGQELGRIVEFPKKSWDEDILDIIK